jgi:hypothetical protein
MKCIIDTPCLWSPSGAYWPETDIQSPDLLWHRPKSLHKVVKRTSDEGTRFLLHVAILMNVTEWPFLVDLAPFTWWVTCRENGHPFGNLFGFGVTFLSFLEVSKHDIRIQVSRLCNAGVGRPVWFDLRHDLCILCSVAGRSSYILYLCMGWMIGPKRFPSYQHRTTVPIYVSFYHSNASLGSYLHMIPIRRAQSRLDYTTNTLTLEVLPLSIPSSPPIRK